MAALTICSYQLFAQNDKQLSIIPEPVEVSIKGDSSYMLLRGTAIRTEADLQFPAQYLADYIDQYLGISLQVLLPQPEKRRTKQSAMTESISHGIRLVNLRNGDIEGGYRLRITLDKGVEIEGNDAAGVFYGVQTLIQLLPTQAGILPKLPEVEIVDYPRFGYRGMHLDVVRHFFPIEYIKRYIDYMALHKLN